LKNIPVRTLKKGIRTRNFSAAKKLASPRYIANALSAALLDGDADAFKEILAAHLEVINKDSFYKKAGVSRRSLFRMLSPEGNPTLENIAKVISTLKDAA